MDRVQEVLSDPESMQQIQELASMLSAEMGGSQPTQSDEPNGAPTADTPPTTDAPTDDFDVSKVFKLVQLLNGASDSQDATLLLAIKPYLTPERQGRVDRAIRLMKVYDVFVSAKSSGLLNGLEGLL